MRLIISRFDSYLIIQSWELKTFNKWWENKEINNTITISIRCQEYSVIRYRIIVLIWTRLKTGTPWCHIKHITEINYRKMMVTKLDLEVGWRLFILKLPNEIISVIIRLYTMMWLFQSTYWIIGVYCDQSASFWCGNGEEIDIVCNANYNTIIFDWKWTEIWVLTPPSLIRVSLVEMSECVSRLLASLAVWVQSGDVFISAAIARLVNFTRR